MKQCSICREEKSFSCFSADRNRKGGLAGECRECRATRYRENRAKEIARAKAWQAANPDRVTQNNAAYYGRNVQSEAERNTRWRQQNPEGKAAIDARRRTRKTEAGGSFSAAEWRQLKAGYGNCCLCCGISGENATLAADHVIPVALGGTSNIENIQPLCRSCNSRKKDTVVDYRRI